jgi:hypothetical protein
VSVSGSGTATLGSVTLAFAHSALASTDGSSFSADVSANPGG